QIRLAPEEPHDAVVLFACEAMTLENLQVDHVARLRGSPYNGRLQREACSRAKGLNDGFEDQSSVDAAEQRLARALGVRHHADDVAPLVANRRDRADRSVRVPLVVDLTLRIRVARTPLALRLELLHCLRVSVGV